MMIQQGTIAKNRYVEDGIDSEALGQLSPHSQMLDYMLSTKFAPVWMLQQDEAYGDTLLHIAAELQNVTFTRIVLTKSQEALSQDESLLKVKNLAGLTPEELLAKELVKAENGINETKTERILGKLTQIKDLFPKSDIYNTQ